MARRGQCRCGLILTFHRTSQGYKMRCPSCGAVVRLRVGEKRRKRRAPKEIDVELVSLSELSAERRPAPPRGGPWVIVLAVAAAGVMLLAVAAGAVWWFLY
jgi:hypothetical protein